MLIMFHFYIKMFNVEQNKHQKGRDLTLLHCSRQISFLYNKEKLKQRVISWNFISMYNQI